MDFKKFFSSSGGKYMVNRGSRDTRGPSKNLSSSSGHPAPSKAADPKDHKAASSNTHPAPSKPAGAKDQKPPSSSSHPAAPKPAGAKDQKTPSSSKPAPGRNPLTNGDIKDSSKMPAPIIKVGAAHLGASSGDLREKPPSAGLFGGSVPDVRHAEADGRKRAAGVLGGPVSADGSQVPRHSKSEASKKLIRGALAANELLVNLEPAQAAAVVDAMHEKQLPAGSLLIQEGEMGSNLFVSAEGAFEVHKGDRLLSTFGPGKVFGEIAILYNTRRQASIRVAAGADARVWVLGRKVFQQIMMTSGLQRTETNVRFLRSVPLLSELDDRALARMADLLRARFYTAGSAIVRQGERGDAFFIISGGSVRVTRTVSGVEEQRPLVLGRGDYFGEQALLKGAVGLRQATVTALPPGVECLALEREPFERLLGGLKELRDKTYDAPPPAATATPLKNKALLGRLDEEHRDLALADLRRVATLGVGGFGRVELVTSAAGQQVFALKVMKKTHVVAQQQQQHALSEKAALLACKDCPFVARLYRTYRDAKYVYMLMEPCLGGDVFSHLQKRRFFDDKAARFVAACVVEALDFLHHRGFIYRDLKPENLLLDRRGYVKLVDFGFAKRLAPGAKTWTFAGTPEYVAPELVLSKGHDRAADLWSLGVLVHELLTGRPPFRGADHVKTYNLILKGVDAVAFPPHMSKHAQSLVRRLCRGAPEERLGYQRAGVAEIREHRWFQGTDWAALRKGSLKAPIVPPVKGPLDVANFDRYPADADAPPDELSGWDKDF